MGLRGSTTLPRKAGRSLPFRPIFSPAPHGAGGAPIPEPGSRQDAHYGQVPSVRWRVNLGTESRSRCLRLGVEKLSESACAFRSQIPLVWQEPISARGVWIADMLSQPLENTSPVPWLLSAVRFRGASLSADSRHGLRWGIPRREPRTSVTFWAGRPARNSSPSDSVALNARRFEWGCAAAQPSRAR